MKELGGVGAVVLGGMLLLTIKVGPVEQGPVAARPAAARGGAIAAVARPVEAPAPRPAPATSPVRPCALSGEPAGSAEPEDGKGKREVGAPPRDRLELAVRALEVRAFSLSAQSGALGLL